MIRFFDNNQHSESGSGFRTVYASKVLKDGTILLEPAGVEDIHAKIQAEKDSTDLAQIIAYYQQTGDDSVFHKTVGQFIDSTKQPKTLADVLQLSIDAHAAYDSLSAEQKKSFDNDFNKFFATAGEKEWCEKLGLVEDESAAVDVVEKEGVDSGS